MRLLLLATVLFLTSCQTPFLVFPGRELPGTVVYVQSFAFAKHYKLLRLQTGLEQPYSVILRTTVIDDRLYIDASPKRKWARNLEASTDIKVKLGDSVYPAKAVLVEDKRITEHFISNRKIYEVRPVSN